MAELRTMFLFCALFIIFVLVMCSTLFEYPPQLCFWLVVLSTAAFTSLFVCICTDEFYYNCHVKRYVKTCTAVKSLIQDCRILPVDSNKESLIWMMMAMAYMFINGAISVLIARNMKWALPETIFAMELLPGVVPGFLMVVYAFFLIHYIVILAKTKINRQMRPVYIDMEWKVVLNGFIKHCLFISCCYFVDRIEELDESRNKDPSKFIFRRSAVCVSFMHFFLFCMHLWLKPIETLPNVFKYVPVVPSIGLLYYSQYRCNHSEEILMLAHQDVGLLANVTLLIVMTIYEDFMLKKFNYTKEIKFEGKYHAGVYKQDTVRQWKKKEKAAIHSLKENQVSNTFERLLIEFFFPIFILLPNYFSTKTFTIENLDFIFGYWIVYYAVFVALYFKCNFVRDQGLVPFCQLLCVWSLYTEFPQTSYLVTKFSDYTSVPLLCFTAWLFLLQVKEDIYHNNIGNIMNFSRTFCYWINYGNPSNDWENIANSLAFIKNIEEYEINVNDEGEVSLNCSHSASESVPSETSKTDYSEQKWGNSYSAPWN